MTGRSAVVLSLLARGLGVLTVRAQVTTPQAGVMTRAQVWIQNRGLGEAVPVAIEQASDAGGVTCLLKRPR